MTARWMTTTMTTEPSDGSVEEPRTHAGKSLAAADPSLRRQILIIEAEAAPATPDLPRTYIERIHDAKDRLLAERELVAHPATDLLKRLVNVHKAEKDYPGLWSEAENFLAAHPATEGLDGDG